MINELPKDIIIYIANFIDYGLDGKNWVQFSLMFKKYKTEILDTFNTRIIYKKTIISQIQQNRNKRAKDVHIIFNKNKPPIQGTITLDYPNDFFDFMLGIEHSEIKYGIYYEYLVVIEGTYNYRTKNKKRRFYIKETQMDITTLDKSLSNEHDILELFQRYFYYSIIERDNRQSKIDKKYHNQYSIGSGEEEKLENDDHQIFTNIIFKLDNKKQIIKTRKWDKIIKENYIQNEKIKKETDKFESPMLILEKELLKTSSKLFGNYLKS